MSSTASTGPELLVDERFHHPEGLVWDERRARLLWVDTYRGHVLAFDPGSGGLKRTNLGGRVGAVAPRRDGGLVCAVDAGFAMLDDAVLTPLGAALHDTARLHMNDGGVDACGRFWAGSMGDGSEHSPRTGALYRLDGDLAISLSLDGVGTSNGIGWSPDSTACYYIDSATRCLDRFVFDLDAGRLGARSPVARFDASPDGLAVDVDGCVWVALNGGWAVQRITPGGAVDRAIRLPASHVTTCAFGGQGRRTLFIATSANRLDAAALTLEKAGYIFALDAGVEGAPTHEFAR